MDKELSSDLIIIYASKDEEDVESIFFSYFGKFKKGDVVEAKDDMGLLMRCEIKKIIIYEEGMALEKPINEIQELKGEVIGNINKTLEAKINYDLFNLVVDIRDTFSYVQYHANCVYKLSTKTEKSSMYSLISRVEIDNQTGHDFDNIKINFHFSNPIFKDFSISACNIYDSFRHKVDLTTDVIVDANKLYEQNGIDVSQVEIECIDQSNNQVLDRVNKTFKILPIRQCTGDWEKASTLFAKYCITGCKELKQIHQKAIELNDNNPIIAYQNHSNDEMLKEIKAIYNALHIYGINYSNPPHSVHAVQNVRLPKDVLTEREGTCLDLSILFCSALLEVGYHPILILISGHAFAGCFLDESMGFKEYVFKNSAELYAQCINSNRRIVVFNAVDIHANSSTSFLTSKKIAEEMVEKENITAIDISSAQNGSFAPIPVKQDDGTLDLEIKPVEINEVEIQENETYIAQHIEAKQEKDRFTTWERKLLDLTTRNKLIKYNPRGTAGSSKGRYNNIFIRKDANEVIELLSRKQKNGENSIIIQCLDEYVEYGKLILDQEQLSNYTNSCFEKEMLLCNATTSVLKKIEQKNRIAVEETGSPTLYMTLGSVCIPDQKSSSKFIVAPLVLLPIEIKRKMYGYAYEMVFDLENAMLNQTVFEFINLKFNCNYSNLYNFDLSTQRIEDLVKSIKDMPGNVASPNYQECTIANFTFSHYVMWQDIKNRKNDLRKNKIISSLLQNTSLIEDDDYFKGKTSESLDNMNNFAAPLPYDSTQLKAIIECGRGNSFILDGPPGTGKSQTIVNMIVNAIYNGKKVLFIAEKAAALDVVKARLLKLGLDRFVLSLYGDSYTKSSFFEQFRRSYNLGLFQSSGNLTSVLECIEKEKQEITKELSKLHNKGEKNENFYSLYEAIVNYKSTIEYKNILKVKDEFLNGYDSIKDDLIRESISKLINLISEIGNYDSCIAKNLQITSYGFLDQENIKNSFNELSNNLTTTDTRFKKLLSELDIETKSTEKNWEIISGLFSTIYIKNINLLKVAENIDYFETSSIRDALNTCKKISETRKELAMLIHQDQIDKVEVHSLEKLLSSNNVFDKLLFKSKAKKCLSNALLNNVLVTRENVAKIVDLVNKNALLVKEYNVNKTLISNFFNENIIERLDILDVYITNYESTLEFYSALKSLLANDETKELYRTISNNLIHFTKAKIIETNTTYTSFVESLKEYKKSVSRTQEKYPFNKELLDRDDAVEAIISITDFVNNDENSKIIEQISKINSHVEYLINSGLYEISDLVKNNTQSLLNLDKFYENGLSYAFIYRYFLNEDYFNSFSSEDYEENIEKYVGLIKKYNNLCVEELKGKITKNFTNMYSPTPIGELVKTATNSGRGTTIRNALRMYQDYFRAYFPCFLMSPMSAAQLLGTDAKKFDIVIFDEASQIPTSEAIGPLARGNALIVAGDPKQMPPSNYFSANVDETGDENEENANKYQDSESFLDDCISIGLPSIGLSFHYRSRHESLIQFSNHHFYDGKLFTFPSADSLNCHIKFKYIPVIKKDNSLSPEEEKAIIDTFRMTALQPSNKGKSIGIIVFNTTQQDKLQESLEKLIDSDSKLREVLDIPEDKYFIKNLENVQGDERDIIIMSIGFAKNASGKANICGPLTLEKAERRLNVAASRAKERMIIISTIKANDIDASKSKNKGPSSLRAFLEYAESSSMDKEEAQTKNHVVGIADFIKRDIETKTEIAADLYIGSNTFKVDLALRQKGSNKYVLGILLDEKPLLDNVSCRDRFYVQKTILEGLEWNILRIYTVQYYRHPSDTLKKIINAFEESVKKEQSETNQPQIQIIDDAPSILKIETKPYKETVFHSNEHIYYEGIDHSYFHREIAELIKRIIETEGPISFTQICERMKSVFLISKAGNKVKSLIKNHADKCDPRVQTTTDFESETFYWLCDPLLSSNTVCLRISPNRGIEDYSKEELTYLINCFIDFKKKVGKEELIRLICDYFKVSAGRKIRDKILYCIDQAKENHHLHSGYIETF